jgi:hypothetical protein
MEYILVADASSSHAVICPYNADIHEVEEAAEAIATNHGMRFDDCVHQIGTNLDIQLV